MTLKGRYIVPSRKPRRRQWQRNVATQIKGFMTKLIAVRMRINLYAFFCRCLQNNNVK